MTNENLQINIGANTQELQAGLNQATQSVTNFGNALKTASKPTADATQSLVNLSRIAQDAPYGFQGIANNLNPMLESFQRLKVETGSTSLALKSMAAGLAGPAGIGLALGVASSLLVTFGDKIFASSKAIDTWAKTLADTNKEIKDSINYTSNQINSMQSLITIATDYTQSENLRAKALREIRETLSSVNKEEAQKLTTQSALIAGAYAYIEALKAQNLQEVSGKKIAELTIQIAEDRSKLASISGKKINPLEMLGLTDSESQILQKRIGNAETLLRQLEEINLKATEAVLKNPFSKMGTQKTEAPKVEKQTSEVQKIIENLRKEERTLDYELSKGRINEFPEGKEKKSYYTEKIDAISDAIKKLSGLTSSEAKKALSDLEKELSSTKLESFDKFINRQGTLAERAMGEKVGDPEQLKRGTKAVEGAGAKNAYEQEQRRIKALDKELKEAQMTAENFANFLASGVTNGLMGMWDAMEQGEDVMESFSNFLKDMVKQLIAMAIQAALVKSIMAAFGGGADGAGGGGLLAGIGKIFGFAEGAVVTQPTLAMIGEGGQGEAVMPLNKLGNMMNSTFNAGAMSGQGSGGTGQFILRGQDLLLSVNRAQKAGNIKGQSISLA